MLKCIPFSKVALLTVAALLATAATSEAQVRAFVGGGGGNYGGTRWGISVGSPYYGGYGGYGSPYYGGYRGYYGSPYYGGFNRGYSGYGYYPTYGYGNYSPYYYSGYSPSYYGGYSPSYYGGSPYYYDSSSAYVQPTTGYQSFYPPDNTTQQSNSASIVIMVPTNAELWFDGKKTSQTGQERWFVTPDLTPGKTFSYEVRATWMDTKGNPVTQERTVMVQAGQRTNVNFLEPDRPTGKE